MNIVKLKDILMPKEFKMAEFFNKHLKGKYAYWIQMRYIFPLDSLDYSSYIKYEQMDSFEYVSEEIPQHIDLYSEEYCMIDFVNCFIDLCTTEEINNICSYRASNAYATDTDIDINSLRSFRTWLATELIKLNTGIYDDHLGKYTSEQIHMLEYYKNNMHNDVIKYLSVFGNYSPSVSFINSNTSCGCCNSNINSNLDISDINTCDVVSIYRKNIHKMMVETFSQPEFWMSLNRDFIKLFKKYIDNIIRTGLSVANVLYTNTDIISECSCYNVNDKYSNSNNILNKLSISLGYIIDEKTSGHINFIHDSFYAWAEYLYEKMIWEK